MAKRHRTKPTEYLILATGVIDHEGVLNQLVENSLFNVTSYEKEPLNILQIKGEKRPLQMAFNDMVDWDKTIKKIPGEYSISLSFMGDTQYTDRWFLNKKRYAECVKNVLNNKIAGYKAAIYKITTTDD